MEAFWVWGFTHAAIFGRVSSSSVEINIASSHQTIIYLHNVVMGGIWYTQKISSVDSFEISVKKTIIFELNVIERYVNVHLKFMWVMRRLAEYSD